MITEEYPHNPDHPIGTCAKCGEEMAYNVPRLGLNGGFIHKNTSNTQCNMTTTEEAVEKIKGLIDIQKKNGNYNCNEYMYGMLIGLECAYFSLLGEEGKFTERPEKWLDDNIPKDFVPTVAEGCQHWRCHIVKNEAGDRDLICSDCDAFIEKLDTSS